MDAQKKHIIQDALTSYNSFYLYDERVIKDRMAQLQNAFSCVTFLYSMKTNHLGRILDTILSSHTIGNTIPSNKHISATKGTFSSFGVDAASLTEAQMAHSHGLVKEDIQYSAPAKPREDVEKALEFSTIIADSLYEIAMLQEIAYKKDTVLSIGVRINPDFTFTQNTGVSTKFGIDEEIFFHEENLQQILNYSHIRIDGLHIHSKSQELEIEHIKAYYKRVFEFAKIFQERVQRPLQFINFGSGIGIPYHKNDTSLDIQALGKCMNAHIQAYKKDFPQTKIYIETGRFLVGESAMYVTKVLDKKVSRGKTYILLHNTLNGFLRTSVNTMVQAIPGTVETVGEGGNSDRGNICDTKQGEFEYEPLYTKKDAFTFIPFFANEGKMREEKNLQRETVSLVGNLCTSTDSIAHDIDLPCLEVGDALVIPNAGSYAWVLSPMQFSSQTPPAQLFLDVTGVVQTAM